MSRSFIFRNRLKAFLWMLFGAVMVLTVLVVMNRFVSTPEKDNEIKTASFDVQKITKPKPKPKPKPKKKESKPKRAPQAPLPTIGSSLSGLDLGIPAFEMGAMDDLGKSLLGDMQDVVMTADSVDVAPKASQRTPMQYPKKARAAGVQGYVTMNLLISEQGNVEKVKVLESQPQGVFDDVAVNGVRSWKFQPARYQGNNVKVWAKQKVRFDLN
ncbi:MAG: energy transducer TonB [Sulfurimonadaceae bacterium]|nr:energy transducer TonB [Sulfurimonadaceae bacterium]